MLIHPRTWGIETIKTKTIIYYFCYKMKNMNTTLEIPEGTDFSADAVNSRVGRERDSGGVD